MAGRGPAPKGARSRACDQRRDEEQLTVIGSDDGSIRGPELPDGFEWPPATVKWWEIWRRSPQAKIFTDTDWSFLLDTAVMHAEFWLGNRSLAAELRLRVAKFGATPEDRARLRMSVGDGPRKRTAMLQPPTASVRRSRLLKAVGDGD